MKTKTTKFLAFGSMLTLAFGVGVAVVASNNSVSKARALDEVVISNATEFLAVFNGSAEKNNYDITLAADINLNGAVYSGVRMAGTFNGTFDGQGHTVSNFSIGGANVGFFNFIGEDAVVKDVTFDWTPTTSDCAGFTFQNNGTIQDCVSKMHIADLKVLKVWAPGGFSKTSGSGSYTRNATEFIYDVTVPGSLTDSGAWPAVVVTEANGDYGSTNVYSFKGDASGNGKARAQGATLQANVTSISVSSENVEMFDDGEEAVTLTMNGGSQYQSLTWTSLDETVATVNGNASGATITAVAGGTTTVRVTVVVDGEVTLTKDIAVTVNTRSYVTAVTMNQSDVSKLEVSSFNLTAVLTGNTYDSITFTSSDVTVAAVDQDGLNCEVSCLKPGVTTISVTVSVNSGTVSDSFELTVTALPVIKITSFIEWYGGHYVGVWLEKSTKTYGTTASYDAYDGTYTHLNGTHVNIYGANDTAQQFDVGTEIFGGTREFLKITIKDSSGNAFCRVVYGTDPNVDSVELDKSTVEVAAGSTVNLSATSNTSALTWESDDTSVATVVGEGKAATVTGVAAGTTTIRVKITSNPSVYAECEVTVLAQAATKLDAPEGLSLNVIGDGGMIIAFAPREHATGYIAVFHGDNDTTVSFATGNGDRIDGHWGDLVNGVTYRVTIIATGDGVQYSNSDESGYAAKSFTCFKTGEAYANYFLGKTNVCDATGETMNITQAIWNDLKEKYDCVYNNQRTSLKAAGTEAEANAIARYNYILGKYSETTYSWLTDFIGTKQTRPASTGLQLFDSAKNSNAAIIIICLSLIGVIGVVSIVAIKKRIQ